MSKTEKDNLKMKPSSDKKHGLCDFEFIPIHLAIMYLSVILCLLHLALGIMLIIFGNYINSGVFALWAITNKPWPAIELENISSTEKDVVFLQVVCWVCGALNFVPVFFMAWLAITYSSLILSPEPWTWLQWNRERKDAMDYIINVDKENDSSQRDEMKLWKTMTLKQRNDIEKYNQEGMFSLKKLDQEILTYV